MDLARKRACDRCNRLKQVCHGDTTKPCEACVRVNSECTFKRPVARIGRPKINPDKSGKKPKGRYSHSACSNCKLKKKKCDEAWPSCLNCERLGLDCSGPLKIIKVKPPEPKNGLEIPVTADKKAGSEAVDIYDHSSREPEVNEQVNEQEQVNNQSGIGQETIINSQLLSVSNDFKGSPDISNFFSSQIGNMVDLTNDLFSLENNDLSSREKLFLNSLIRSPTFPIDFNEFSEKENTANRKMNKMTNVFKINESDQYKPLLTPANDQISPSSVRSGDYPELYEEEKNNLLSLCTIGPYNDIPFKELELLKYFITDVSSLLFVDKASTRFLLTVIPTSLNDAKVRYPILGIAASHRANNMMDDIEYKRDASIYRSKAQSLFIGTSVDYFESNENILLSILLLAIQEIFEGTSLYWNFALEKAAHIIEKRGGLKKVSKFAPLSIQLFCYLDLISSLSTCSSPYVDKSDFNIYEDDDQIERILNNKFGFKFGIAGEIFKIIGNISTLASLRDSRYKTKENEQRFNTLANLVEMKLQNWSPTLDLVADTYQIDNSMDDGRLILSSFTLALQWSAFLRLHQIRHGYNRTDSRITACLEIIMRSMKVIQNNSDLETGLMFPLIMAGSVAYKLSDREYILSRIRTIKKRLKFNYIGEFEKLILLVWNRDSEENHHVNWAKIRYFEYLGLVMF